MKRHPKVRRQRLCSLPVLPVESAPAVLISPVRSDPVIWNLHLLLVSETSCDRKFLLYLTYGMYYTN